MRILFVSTYFPTDLRTKVHGVFQRMGMFVDAIKQIADIDMLFYVPSDIDTSASNVALWEHALSRHWKTNLRLSLCSRYEPAKPLSKWLRCGASAVSFFDQPNYFQISKPPQVQALENCLRSKPDAVFVHRLAAMCPLMLTHAALPPVFFDLDDIEHVAYIRGIDKRYAWKTKIRSFLEVPALLCGERRAIGLARQTFVCSDSDKTYLNQRHLLRDIVTIPNAVNVQDYHPLTSEPSVLFLGTFRFPANRQAAEFLLEHIWPRVQRAMPDARLIIAGAAPENIRGFTTGIPGVEFTGFVDDLDQLYRRSRGVCCPLLAGGGTRIKLLEAAAYGKPIVTTTIGAEGIKMHDNCELLIRDDPESFATSCLALLTKPALCERLGSAARATVAEHYDRVQIIDKIQRQLQTTIAPICQNHSTFETSHAN